MTFQFITQGILMPAVSIFGIIGNSITIKVLKDRDVKLNKEFRDVLSGLATFDNLLLIFTFLLFSLPSLSKTYKDEYFALTVPMLYPATNIFTTASRKSISYENITLDNGSSINVTNTVYEIGISELRSNENYVRDYTLITNSVVMVILPTSIMLISSCLIYRQMLSSMRLGIFTNAQEQARRRRNRNINIMLIGIVVLFLVCHLGEVVIAIYELTQSYRNGKKNPFPDWAGNMVVVNHLLIVINSSLNFVIYCKDIVFRQTVKKMLNSRKEANHVALIRNQMVLETQRTNPCNSQQREIKLDQKGDEPNKKETLPKVHTSVQTNKNDVEDPQAIIVRRIEEMEVIL
ncbi:unnamed protein product [Lepeophtheirus salmonis]|uniref:(salmon louse) hypothetical protein n=1 Tax=Lepeophtheirus salmonis TaxID=72036 RepID=A0A7R8D5W7_LEPSM|nr:unnamed protein product [Lepeophtheirus salmonis]CAF3039433.1 unnamed protein product [Lepeophtheirus salmonis]